MNNKEQPKKGTVGAAIAELVNTHTDDILGEFKLEQALEQVRANNAAIKKFKETLIVQVLE